MFKHKLIKKKLCSYSCLRGKHLVFLETWILVLKHDFKLLLSLITLTVPNETIKIKLRSFITLSKHQFPWGDFLI